jgi:hypothetical protein
MLRCNWLTGCIFVALAVSASKSAAADDPETLRTPAAASRDAHRDKRLPPLLPGEVVEVAPGQRIKVWSSSGPVPVAPNVPQPPSNNQPLYGNGIGAVVVDERSNSGRGRGYSDPRSQDR